ncbi:hypothetical protein CVT23_00030 [Minwuia thermotolerans]|uniref:Uncharacterized protein n=1 Tax=Minwuia thermotolerans TaxID=2056226 RepID=A0A2M9G7R5_9PROT|nr:hypothetical protein CVT23_00030 [Minwuia thermotolerans]
MTRIVGSITGASLALALAACTSMDETADMSETAALEPTAGTPRAAPVTNYDGPHYGPLTEGMFAAGAGYNILVPDQ